MKQNYRRSRSNINAAVWLIGLGILWLTDTWWPGILILIGISMMVQTLIPQPNRAEVAPPQEPAPEAETTKTSEDDIWEKEKESSETPAFAAPSQEKDEALLPAQCPACGGPVGENAHKVEWNGPRAARCPFCNTWLNL